MPNTTLLPLQPDAMTPAQLAAVSYLARYASHTHSLYAYQLRRWFVWCESGGLDPLIEIQRAHVELYIRHLGGCGLMPSSVNTMMHGVRGFFRFAHIDGLIPADPAVYARLPKIHQDESRTQGLDRLELIRFLQVAQTISVHHGALAYLLGNNALRASDAAAVRIEDYRHTLRGHHVLQLVGKGSKPATMPLTVPVLRALEACRGERTDGPLVLRPLSGRPMTDATASDVENDELTSMHRFAVAPEMWFGCLATSDAEGRRSPETVRIYRSQMDKHVLPALAEVRLGEVTTPMLDKVIRALKVDAGGSTAKTCRSIISGILSLAVRYGALTANPVREVERLELARKEARASPRTNGGSGSNNSKPTPWPSARTSPI